MLPETDLVANHCFQLAKKDRSGTELNQYLNLQSLGELQRLARLFLPSKSRLKTKTLLASYLTKEIVLRANRNISFLTSYLVSC